MGRLPYEKALKFQNHGPSVLAVVHRKLIIFNGNANVFGTIPSLLYPNQNHFWCCSFSFEFFLSGFFEMQPFFDWTMGKNRNDWIRKSNLFSRHSLSPSIGMKIERYFIKRDALSTDSKSLTFHELIKIALMGNGRGSMNNILKVYHVIERLLYGCNVHALCFMLSLCSFLRNACGQTDT